MFFTSISYHSPMNKLHAICLGLLLSCPALEAPAQELHGSNGSASVLAPLDFNKKTARRIAPQGIRLRTDFVKSRHQYFVLALANALTDAQRAAIAPAATFVAYLPDRFYLYAAPDAKAAIDAMRRTLGATVEVSAVGTLPYSFKLAAPLLQAVESNTPLPADCRRLVVSTLQSDDLPALAATLDRWGVSHTPQTDQSLLLTADTPALVAQIAALPYVGYVNVERAVAPLAFDMDYITQANRIQSVNYQRRGPIGEGVYFANWEPYGGEHRWGIATFGRNLDRLTDHSTNAHGTDCGLIVSAADNSIEGSTQGMAPGVKILAMNDRTAPLGMHLAGVAPALAQGYSPLVSNHSVGWHIDPAHNDAYSGGARQVDRIIQQENNYMCCYPTGNWAYGTSTYAPYTEPDYGRITGDIKTNKNGLAVHSTLYPGVDVTWANFGPTFDGRMKPEICAQGSGGTSYASPGVAGMTAVLLEAFHTAYPALSPRIDAVKAAMLNTALDVRTYAKGREEGRGIDFRSGYGEINPPAALATIADRRLAFDQSISTGESKDLPLLLPAGQTELRVMLYWNDPPALDGAAKALINDLDLEVIGPDGTTILPWTLDPSASGVTRPAQRGVNRRDNHEQVVITAPDAATPLAPGTYTLRVKGHNVPSGPQNYVLTWQHRPRSIQWTSIPEGFRLAPGQRVLLSWDMTLPADEELLAPNFKEGKMTPKVYYRTSPADTWKRAQPETDLQYWSNIEPKQPRGSVYGKNFLLWRVPDALAHTARLQFRVVASDLEAISANAHVGERLQNRPAILAISADKVKLSWQPARKVSAGKYLIYALYDKYMQVVDSVDISVTEKEVAAPKGVQWRQNQFFAVAVFDAAAGVTGLRSLPSGLNPLNDEATDPADLWKEEYELCTSDVVRLNANRIEGTVQWYHNNRAIAGARAALRTQTIDHAQAGTYHYTISASDGRLLYTSPQTRIVAKDIALADTAVWGDHTWAGYVFNKPGATASAPLLTDGLALYGKFRLPQFSFNSHTELFAWNSGRISDTDNYEGCRSADNANEAIVVMKRRGFRSGRYTLKFERASGIASAVVRDGTGRLLKSLTTAPNSNTTFIGTFNLDENSTIELQWNGVHCVFNAQMARPGSEVTIAPGRIAQRPTFWLDPNRIGGNDGSEVKRLDDALSQAETYTLTTAKGATLVHGASNYNSLLRFQGASSYVGGTSKVYEGNATTDFVVLHPMGASSGDRIVSYGMGRYDIGTIVNGEQRGGNESYALLFDDQRRFAGMRNFNRVLQTRYGSGKMQLVTLRQSATNASISVNGEQVAGNGTPLAANFALHKISIGGAFDLAQPAFYRGNMAEILHYDATLGAANENRVRTYLALKHGISLDHDYVLGNATLYPAKSSAYKYQIAGIGADKTMRLDQKQSRGQHLDGTPAMLIVAIGDLAADNADNPSRFAADRTYYVVGADSPYKPSSRNADNTVSTVRYCLRRTLPAASAQPDLLSLYLPEAPFKVEGKTPYLEIAPAPFAGNTIDEQHEMVLLRPYKYGELSMLRADYAPAATDTYFRVVWRDTPQSIDALTADTPADAVTYDAATRSFCVKTVGAVTIDLLDLSGRLLERRLPVVETTARPAHAPAPGAYIVRIGCADGTSIATKTTVQP